MWNAEFWDIQAFWLDPMSIYLKLFEKDNYVKVSDVQLLLSIVSLCICSSQDQVHPLLWRNLLIFISVLFLSYRHCGLTSVSFICRFRKGAIEIILLNMHMIFTLLTKQQWGCVIFVYFTIKYVAFLWWETVFEINNKNKNSSCESQLSMLSWQSFNI